jgi:predicted transcriptional regulator
MRSVRVMPDVLAKIDAISPNRSALTIMALRLKVEGLEAEASDLPKIPPLKQAFTFRLPDDLATSIDTLRGKIPRNLFIEDALLEFVIGVAQENPRYMSGARWLKDQYGLDSTVIEEIEREEVKV